MRFTNHNEKFNLALEQIVREIPNYGKIAFQLCDPGTDDLVSMVQAYAHPEKLEILGIISCDGNVSRINTTDNSLSIGEVTGREDIKVFPGSDGPTAGTAHHEDGVHVFGSKGLGNITLPKPHLEAEKIDGVQYAINAIKNAAAPITLISTGGMTDLYKILLGLEKSDFKNIAAISIMGGVFDQKESNAPLEALGAKKYTRKIFNQKPNETEILPNSINIYQEPKGDYALIRHNSGLEEIIDLRHVTGFESALRFGNLGVDGNFDIYFEKSLDAVFEFIGKNSKYTRWAEFNIIYDVIAAKAFFEMAQENDVPTIVSSLDLTHTLCFGKEESLSLRSINNYPAKLLADLMLDVPLPYRHRFGFDKPKQPAHDLNATMCLSDPDLYQARRGFVVVDGEDKPESRGKTSFQEDDRGNVYQLYVPVEKRPEFFKRLEEDLKTYNTPTHIIKGILYDIRSFDQIDAALKKIDAVIHENNFFGELSMAGLLISPEITEALGRMCKKYPKIIPVKLPRMDASPKITKPSESRYSLSGHSKLQINDNELEKNDEGMNLEALLKNDLEIKF